MLASLVAVVIWLAGLLLAPRVRDTLGTDDIAVAIVVTAHHLDDLLVRPPFAPAGVAEVSGRRSSSRPAPI